MAKFKCTSCSTSFEDEINGIVCCPKCDKVVPLPPNMTDDEKEKVYNEAILSSNRVRLSSNIEELIFIFEQLGDYQDSQHQAERCRNKLVDAKKDEKFALATDKMEHETIRSCKEAIALFEELGEWKGASFKADECRVKLNNLLVKREHRRDLAAKITMISCAVIIVLSLIAWAIIQFLVPAIRYSWALSRIEKGQYDKGYAILEDLGNYKNAPTELKKSKYNRALVYETDGDLILACDFYDQARGYSDANARLYNVCKQLTIKEQLSVLDIGSTVLFGVYEQDPELEGKETIEWIIVDKKGDDVLIVSKNVLEGTKYSETASLWSKSTLRNWLNDYFYFNSFSSKDRFNIVPKTISTIHRNTEGVEKFDSSEDFIFLLSDTEIASYLPTKDERCGEATKNLIERINATVPPVMHINPGNNCAHYWLRTISPDGNVLYVNGSGGVNDEGKNCMNVLGVRPALWVSTKKTSN